MQKIFDPFQITGRANGPVGRDHIHPGPHAGQGLRQNIAGHGRPRDQNPPAGQFLPAHLVNQGLGDIFGRHQVHAHPHPLDLLGGSGSDGAELDSLQRADVLPAGLEPFQEIQNAVGACENQPVVLLNFSDGAVQCLP